MRNDSNWEERQDTKMLVERRYELYMRQKFLDEMEQKRVEGKEKKIVCTACGCEKISSICFRCD